MCIPYSYLCAIPLQYRFCPYIIIAVIVTKTTASVLFSSKETVVIGYYTPVSTEIHINICSIVMLCIAIHGHLICLDKRPMPNAHI